MNSRDYVQAQIAKLKAQMPPQDAAWELAKLTIGWPYIFGDRGSYCTPSHRKAVYNSHGGDKLIERCQVLSGSKSSCTGCKWFPGGKKVLAFDCRGFTYWVLYKIYGWELQGAGCTSQWNNASNWKMKGKVIDGLPQDTLCCLFYSKDGKEKTWEHTGLLYKGQTIECQVGVEYHEKPDKKWTHWAIPACISGDLPPVPTPTPDQRPTLKKGDSGEYVQLLQVTLIQRGYDCGSYGADGKFGKNTEAAVKRFQLDHGLTADGIIGEKTWNALDGAEPAIYYTVTVPHMTATQADALILQYPGSTKTEERG